ncbi:MAG: transposase [Paracoccaceae bacterium]
MLERCALRNGNVHSSGWRDVARSVVARYAGRDLGGRFFRADAAYAIPRDLYAAGKARFFYAIRLPANAVLREKISASADTARGTAFADQGQTVLRGLRVSGGVLGQAAASSAKIEWHPGELFPKVGFIVTNLPMEPDKW